MIIFSTIPVFIAIAMIFVLKLLRIMVHKRRKQVTVKELITRLLDEDMNSNVYVKTRYKEVSENGTHGAIFDIAEIEVGATNGVNICFIDWRK